MKLFFLLSSLFFPLFPAPPPPLHFVSLLPEWNQYKLHHNKVYATVEEDERRLRLYLAAKERVQQHNSKYQRGQTSYAMALNRFADWFPEEFDRLNGLRFEGSEQRREADTIRIKPGTDVPKSWNWVEKGAVTSVKNQGHCGSCYAFSAVGALEGLMYLKNKTIEDLSEQELVDCSGNFGCGGGFMRTCFEYVRNRGGIDSDESYPYEAREGDCRACEGEVAASCTGSKYVPRDEEAMKAVVATMGPVSIGFAASLEFRSYSEGVYDGSCAGHINHGMLIVGYGTDNETGDDYWLVKNSWSSDWGEEGYVRIARGENLCQITHGAIIPTYDD